MKKMCAVGVMVLCFGLRPSQVLESDNDILQLDALNKKDEARKKQDSLQAEESSYQAKSSLEQWQQAYNKEQERIKRGYEG